MRTTLQNVMAYRTMYALTGLKQIGSSNKLKATHFVCCLVYGRAPLWGVFRAKDGVLIQQCISKEQVLRLHPGKILRRMQASWTLNYVEQALEFEQRQSDLDKQVVKDDKPAEEIEIFI